MPVRALVFAACMAAPLWLIWQAWPTLAVAGLIDRLEQGAAAPDDFMAPALAASLAPQIQRVLDAERVRDQRWAAAGQALRGSAAALHAVASLPVLLAQPLAPEAAASVKRTQQALLSPPAAPPPDTRHPAAELARRLAAAAPLARLIRAAFQRAPETWPAGRLDQFRFVHDRLRQPDPDSALLALTPDGVAPFAASRLTVLEFRREGRGSWRLAGVRLPPDDDHARVLLDAAAEGLAGQAP